MKVFSEYEYFCKIFEYEYEYLSFLSRVFEYEYEYLKTSIRIPTNTNTEYDYTMSATMMTTQVENISLSFGSHDPGLQEMEAANSNFVKITFMSPDLINNVQD